MRLASRSQAQALPWAWPASDFYPFCRLVSARAGAWVDPARVENLPGVSVTGGYAVDGNVDCWLNAVVGAEVGGRDVRAVEGRWIGTRAAGSRAGRPLGGDKGGPRRELNGIEGAIPGVEASSYMYADLVDCHR